MLCLRGSMCGRSNHKSKAHPLLCYFSIRHTCTVCAEIRKANPKFNIYSHITNNFDAADSTCMRKRIHKPKLFTSKMTKECPYLSSGSSPAIAVKLSQRLPAKSYLKCFDMLSYVNIMNLLMDSGVPLFHWWQNIYLAILEVLSLKVSPFSTYMYSSSTADLWEARPRGGREGSTSYQTPLLSGILQSAPIIQIYWTAIYVSSWTFSDKRSQIQVKLDTQDDERCFWNKTIRFSFSMITRVCTYLCIGDCSCSPSCGYSDCKFREDHSYHRDILGHYTRHPSIPRNTDTSDWFCHMYHGLNSLTDILPFCEK